MARKKTEKLDTESFCRSLSELLQRSGKRRRGTTVLVALSGGPDSVALLQLMSVVGKDLGLNIAAAHVNYGLRGEDSDADERFCRQLCKQLKIRLFVEKAGLARQRKEKNLQAEARRTRYEFFARICREHRFSLIATGHNKNDSVETILINLSRGAGTFGLTGIDPVSGNIIRPLLGYTREAIIKYLRSKRLSYRVDRSNLENKYTRNKVRRVLLPALERVFGERVVDNITRTGAILRQQELFVKAQVEGLLAREARTTAFGKIVLDLKKFRRDDAFIRQLVVAACYESLTGSLKDFDQAAAQRVIDLVRAKIGRVDLTSGVVAEIADDRLYLYREERRKPSVMTVTKSVMVLRTYGLELSVSELSAAELTQRELRGGKNMRVFVDKNAVSGRLAVRSARPGDRFRPLGLQGSKKLSDFFIDRRIDRPLREEIPLLLCGKKIVWIIGQEIADEVKITARSKRALKLEVTPYRPL